MCDNIFYVTKCPDGVAEGADEWGHFYEDEMDEVFEHDWVNGVVDQDYMDEEYNDSGHLRPLDYFFPNDCR